VARYRKLYVHMWHDAKVRALSRPGPNAQSLWVACLGGEQTDVIPGVFKIGEAAFAEQLGWPLEGFRKAFREVFQQGMVKASWDDRLVWVPNGIKWNPPESPNVIRNWAEPWRHLPECALKVEIWHAFKAFFEGFKEGFREAFAEALPKPVSSDQGAVIREQEEEEKIAEAEIAKPKRSRKQKQSPEAAPSGVSEVRRSYLEHFEAKYGQQGIWGAREGGQCAQLLRSWTAEQLLDLMPYFFAWKNADVIKDHHPFGVGSNSFVLKVHRLRGDVFNPERNRDAGAARALERQTEKAGAIDDAVAGAREILKQQGVIS
jgi:hypothetical protein